MTLSISEQGVWGGCVPGLDSRDRQEKKTKHWKHWVQYVWDMLCLRYTVPTNMSLCIN